MIKGFLQEKLVAQQDIKSLQGDNMLGTIDRRASKVLFGGNVQYQQSPLDFVQIISKLPQIQYQQNNDQKLKAFQNMDFTTQIQSLAATPNIDLIKKIREQAKVVRQHYSN